jgi:hypothetical protein
MQLKNNQIVIDLLVKYATPYRVDNTYIITHYSSYTIFKGNDWNDIKLYVDSAFDGNHYFMNDVIRYSSLEIIKQFYYYYLPNPDCALLVKYLKTICECSDDNVELLHFVWDTFGCANKALGLYRSTLILGSVRDGNFKIIKYLIELNLLPKPIEMIDYYFNIGRYSLVDFMIRNYDIDKKELCEIYNKHFSGKLNNGPSLKNLIKISFRLESNGFIQLNKLSLESSFLNSCHKGDTYFVKKYLKYYRTEEYLIKTAMMITRDEDIILMLRSTKN